MQDTLSHRSFLAFLASSQHGFLWSKEKGLDALKTQSSGLTSETIVLITEALHAQIVHQVLIELSDALDIKLVKLHTLSDRLSCEGLVIKGTALKGVTDQVLKAKLLHIEKQFAVNMGLTRQAPKLSKPGLLVMDMDSTMIKMECIDEIARLAGRYEEVAQVTVQAMQGKLEFADSLKSRVGCLTGVEESALQTIKNQLPLMPGLVNLVALLREHAWKLAIASGGFTYFADHLQQWLELDDAASNQLEVVEGKLTGSTIGPVIDAKKKAQTLVELAEKYAIGSQQTVAMGDGANDLEMMKQAHLGVAFHAKPKVKAQADVAVSDYSLDALVLFLED